MTLTSFTQSSQQLLRAFLTDNSFIKHNSSRFCSGQKLR